MNYYEKIIKEKEMRNAGPKEISASEKNECIDLVKSAIRHLESTLQQVKNWKQIDPYFDIEGWKRRASQIVREADNLHY